MKYNLTITITYEADSDIEAMEEKSDILDEMRENYDVEVH